jgi:hypothetical protein
MFDNVPAIPTVHAIARKSDALSYKSGEVDVVTEGAGKARV